MAGVCFMCREWSREAVARFSDRGVRLCMVCWHECILEAAIQKARLGEGGVKGEPDSGSLGEGPDDPVTPPLVL